MLYLSIYVKLFWLRFRKEMKELEVIVENLLSEVFVTVTQVSEGLDTLQAMYQYSKRRDLFTEFEKRTIKVIYKCKLNVFPVKFHYNC